MRLISATSPVKKVSSKMNSAYGDNFCANCTHDCHCDSSCVKCECTDCKCKKMYVDTDKDWGATSTTME